MSLLNKTFFASIGIELDDAEYQALAAHFDSTLHERVVNEIVEGLTPEQAAELANLGDDDERVNQWLIDNVPDLQDIVQDEVDILLGEIAEDSDQFNQSAA